jgi:hypothetical protein
MEFFLPFKIQPYPFTISYRDKILFIGSCFSEEIGNKMDELKFDILQNPNGILYDPVSIANALFSYIKNKPVEENDLFFLNGLWHSWKHHSTFSGVNKKDVLKKINVSQSGAHVFLKEAKFLIITPGTAFAYRLRENGQYVANCHKASSHFFEKKLLPTEQIISFFTEVQNALKKFNPGLKIIFTVSPVKHVKDGVVENNRSKARLIESVHTVAEQNENVFYFPSYELVTDVLRDYRFYKNDCVHPNETAISFVFEKFCDSVLDDASKKIIEKIKPLLSAVNHKPFVKESIAHKQFIASQSERIAALEKEYPFLDLSKEKKHFGN